MDDAAIQALKIKINNIIDSLNSQIKECDKKIAQQNQIIEIQKRNLTQNTEMIVIIETNLKELENQKNDNMAKKVSITTSRVILIGQIAELNREIESIKKEIESRTSPGAIAWDVFNHIFNPIGAAISDVVRALYDNLNEKVKKVAQNQQEVNEKQSKLAEYDKAYAEAVATANQLAPTYDKLKQEGDHVTQLLKECGVTKTNAENLKLQLETFETQAKTLLFKCDSSKEVLDYGIDEVSKLETQVRAFFNQNHLTINF